MMAGRDRYARIADFYDLLELPFEYGRYRTLRPHLFRGLSGSILDAGLGTGRNIPFYPDESRVTGIDLSPAMLARARARAVRLGVGVELVECDVAATAFPDDCFDAIVATFLFCVIAEDRQLAALRELARICKPSGEIRLLDYRLAHTPFRRAIMQAWAPWVRWAYGAAFDRETEQKIPLAGLDIVETRYLYRDTIKLIVVRPASTKRD